MTKVAKVQLRVEVGAYQVRRVLYLDVPLPDEAVEVQGEGQIVRAPSDKDIADRVVASLFMRATP